MKPRIYTIGHSTRSFDELVEILKHYEINQLVDVRTVPKSRTNPQFNQETLESHLPATGIDYRHISGLGGLRYARKDSPNQGWHNDSFRGYADYMQTDEFRMSLDQLMSLGKQSTVAIMCAEAVPWRCHRSMIGDALLAHDWSVKDIFDIKKVTDEKMTKFALVEGTAVTYPDDQPKRD